MMNLIFPCSKRKMERREAILIPNVYLVMYLININKINNFNFNFKLLYIQILLKIII